MTGVEIGVTAAGAALIAVLVWFFFGPRRAEGAEMRGDRRELPQDKKELKRDRRELHRDRHQTHRAKHSS